jgi:hypothetical protein
MPSFIPTSFFNDVFKGNIDVDTDTFKRMLLGSGASALTKDNLLKRSNATSYEVTGTNYTAGGTACTPTVSAIDTANDRQEIVWGSTNWPTSTISAYYSFIYKSRGGADTADEACFLNSFADFTTPPVATTAGTFTCGADTTRIQN